jgi:hypothetical protein
MITFVVLNDDKSTEILCNLDNTMLDLKKKIILEYKLGVEYIDLIFDLERPIRGMGKFNLESGMMPRTFDNYNFDRYNLDNRIIKLKYVEVDDYIPNIKKTSGNGIYKLKKDDDNLNDNSFNINSEIEFPKLC